jgi:4-hydroxy-tetrahydrodipicolinate synthase
VRFPGIIPALTTPFDASDAVDADALQANVAALLDAGVHGLVACGTMGEAGSMSAAERRVVVDAVVEAAAGRVPVVVGISSGTPAASIAHAAGAAAAGADAVMLLPPVGYAADEREVEAFFTAVAGASDLPVMLYNNPEASGTDLPAALIARLVAQVPGIVAVKECSGDARRIAALLALTDVEVLVGGDDWALEGFCAGATGWVSGVADVAPEACVELFERCRAADLEGAREVNARLLPLARFDMTPKLVQFYKAGQDLVGRAGGPSRAPRLPLTEAEDAALREALAVLRGEAVPA